MNGEQHDLVKTGSDQVLAKDKLAILNRLGFCLKRYLIQFRVRDSGEMGRDKSGLKPKLQS